MQGFAADLVAVLAFAEQVVPQLQRAAFQGFRCWLSTVMKKSFSASISSLLGKYQSSSGV
jgi:hypothetical protein